QGVDRDQVTLLPARLDEYVAEDNPVRAVDAFVDGLDLEGLGFIHVQPLDIGRPGYHPRMLLKLCIYGYLNRVPSSRRLERECQRNIEAMWLTGQLAPDFKTIADFRKDNGPAIRKGVPCVHRTVPQARSVEQVYVLARDLTDGGAPMVILAQDLLTLP